MLKQLSRSKYSKDRPSLVVKQEGRQEGDEGSVLRLPALWECAGVHFTDVEHRQNYEHEHADDSSQQPPDNVDEQEVRRVPRPQDRVQQVVVASEYQGLSDILFHQNFGDDVAQNNLEEDPDAPDVEEEDIESFAGQHQQKDEQEVRPDLQTITCTLIRRG